MKTADIARPAFFALTKVAAEAPIEHGVLAQRAKRELLETAKGYKALTPAARLTAVCKAEDYAAEMVTVAAASGFPVSAANAQVAYDLTVTALAELSPLYEGEEAQARYENNLFASRIAAVFNAPDEAFA